VKEHIGIERNELTDKLAKQAAGDDERNLVYNRIPITTIATELKKEGPPSDRDNGKPPTNEHHTDPSSQQ
jgi:hypothetical protein